jgi:hypothetical protein
MYNIFFAEEIIKKYSPEMLVVNMQNVDVCHTNFSQYCYHLNRADYAVAHLWQTIQNDPIMGGNTVMIVAPEHGRNLDGNSTFDSNGRAAIDHTASINGAGDQTAREIFCLVLGPPGVVKQNHVVSAVTGESVEIASAMANMLGFDTDIPAGIKSEMDFRNFSTSGISQAFV